ncbi:MAG TPA: LPS export ABC transporter periplasmic protein LptC [Candidatus Baltobacteraceae bacterium]|jgi:LPS export ABC transporter protein LptC|nr:LPS export ABC transporter periplasmic protein LptC [Candidatus Baltobacteraceae bacterium]
MSAPFRRPALAMVVLLAACNPQPAHRPGASPSPTPSANLPPIVIRGHGTASQPVSMVHQAGNRRDYELSAASTESRSAQNLAQAKFQQVTVTFFDKDGTRLTATSPQASTDERGRRVTLSDGVHATTSTGLNLTCDRLTYDQQTALLHGEGHVRITGMQGGQQEVLTGTTFTSNVKLTQMVVR